MADVKSFRNDFPEFQDWNYYPDAQINFWLGIGNTLLNASAWGEILDHGLELFIAHHLAMARQNSAAAATGAVPGQATGVVTAKAVDKVSVAYDTSVGVLENAAHFNLTTYGTQFIYLARLVGAGGIQVSGCGGVGIMPIWSVQ